MVCEEAGNAQEIAGGISLGGLLSLKADVYDLARKRQRLLSVSTSQVRKFKWPASKCLPVSKEFASQALSVVTAYAGKSTRGSFETVAVKPQSFAVFTRRCLQLGQPATVATFTEAQTQIAAREEEKRRAAARRDKYKQRSSIGSKSALSAEPGLPGTVPGADVITTAFWTFTEVGAKKPPTIRAAAI